MNFKKPDHEAAMAKAQLAQIARNAMAVYKMINEGDELDGWISSYITEANDHMNSVHEKMAYDQAVLKDDNFDVTDISNNDYMRIKGIVDKKYPGYELSSLNIGHDGYIEIEIYNYKTHDTKHLKTKSTSENKQGVLKDAVESGPRSYEESAQYQIKSSLCEQWLQKKYQGR